MKMESSRKGVPLANHEDCVTGRPIPRNSVVLHVDECSCSVGKVDDSSVGFDCDNGEFIHESLLANAEHTDR